MGTTRTQVLYAKSILFRDSWTEHSRAIASEEFDKLCFEFGIELDEDVSAVYFSRFTPSTRRYTWT